VFELAVLAAVVLACMAATTLVANAAGRVLVAVEYALVMGSVLVILFVTAFVGAEVIMRYAVNAPIPGHLELAELMMPPIVFLALSYTQATRGHVGMDLLLDALAPAVRRIAQIVVLLVSIMICSILAFFSFKNAWQLWLLDDVTMSPPYFKTWPSAVAIPIGYGLISLRMYVQLLHVYDPDRFAENAPAHEGFEGGE
jgi:TRAP-type C4-dicarboxylate transport system permease small subunit